MKLLVINGPNINMLGIREKDIYGAQTYAELVRYIEGICAENQIQVEVFQSNHEGAIVDKLQAAYRRVDGIVINPAAYTHTSIAILDALKAIDVPAVEVHLSDISKREAFRQVSYTASICKKSFIGLGFDGYKEAILYLKDYLAHK